MIALVSLIYGWIGCALGEAFWGDYGAIWGCLAALPTVLIPYVIGRIDESRVWREALR